MIMSYGDFFKGFFIGLIVGVIAAAVVGYMYLGIGTGQQAQQNGEQAPEETGLEGEVIDKPHPAMVRGTKTPANDAHTFPRADPNIVIA